VKYLSNDNKFIYVRIEAAVEYLQIAASPFGSGAKISGQLQVISETWTY